MFPPAAINGLFDLPLPQGQVLQELQHGPTQNTKEPLTGVSQNTKELLTGVSQNTKGVSSE